VAEGVLTQADPRIEEDGSIFVAGQHISPGDEITIKGRRGKFKFKCASFTSEGRMVVSTIGPMGMHQAFRDFYAEQVKVMPATKPRRKRRVL
jgi:hypothetical protein